jgi:hypothetical protein
VSAEDAPIFNPRTERFGDHFIVRRSGIIEGRTKSARATVALLRMNRDLAIALRIEERLRGAFPWAERRR